jgi:hypothetical protein
MATLNLTSTTAVTLDESAGLQNFTASTAAGDKDDNDIAAASLPATFLTWLSTAGVGTAINGALSGYTGTGSGSNAFTFSVTGASGMGFTDAAGAPLSDGASNLFTTAGNEEIKLYTDGVNDNIMYGMAGGNIVFAAFLEETGVPVTGAKMWMVQYEAIKDPTLDADESLNLLDHVWVTVDQQQAFSLAGAPSGQNLFLIIGNADVGVVVTGLHAADESTGAAVNTGDTVNTSQGGGSTTIGNTNQMVDPGEGVVFTFVTNPVMNYTVPNLSSGEADEESNIQFGGLYDQGGASISVSQLQKAKMATVQLAAYETNAAQGDAFIGGAGQTNSAVNITNVTVTNAAGVLLETYGDTDNDGLTITITGGVATVTGVKAGYVMAYETDGMHNRVIVSNVGAGANKASFDIGGFSLTESAKSTAEIGGLMNFEDDGPNVVPGTPVNTTNLNTQDAQTIGIATDSDTQDLSGAFTGGTAGFGTDGDGGTSWAFALSLALDGENSGLNSHGDAIYLYIDGAGKVTGSTSTTEAGILAANTIFDLATTSAGVVTLQQYAQIDHAAPGVSSNFAAQQAALGAALISLDGTASITDGDGDTGGGMASLDLGPFVRFDDDGPTVFTPDAVNLQNSGSSSATGDLNALGSVGADKAGLVTFADGNIADDYLYDTNGNALMADGQKIVMSGFGTNTLTATTESGGATVFVATTDSAADTYNITYSMAIGDGAHTSLLGAAPVKQGNPTYNILNNVGGTTLDLLFSGGDTSGGLPGAHTVNVSTTGAGVDNQSMNRTGTLGETLRIDFAIGATLAGSPSGSDFNLGTHKTVNGYSFLLSQNTPNGTTATAFVKVYDADGDKILTGDAGDVADTISELKVDNVVMYSTGGGISSPTMINGSLVTAILSGGGVILTGLRADNPTDPLITVSTADGFNRVEVSNYAGQTVNGNVLGGTSFDIKPAGVEQAVAGNPFAFNLPVILTDFDADYTGIQIIGVNMTPVPVGP